MQTTMGVTPVAAAAADVEMTDDTAELGGLPADVTTLIDETHKT